MKFNPELSSFVKRIPAIKEDRNYWFVRTDGGDYYQDFVNGGYVAIGYNEVSLKDISLASQIARDDKLVSLLTERIKKIYPNDLRPGLVAGQLARFTYLIKKQDIVIIPSKSSDILHFGEVTDNAVYLKDVNDPCPHQKRKKVKWLKYKNKSALEAEFYKMIFTHTTVSDANEYATYIDRTLHSFFIKGQNAHLVLDVKTKSKISASTFYDFGEIFRLVDELSASQGDAESDTLSIKSNVQSPGILEIIQASQVPIGLILIGIIINSLTGGSFSFKIKANKKVGLDIEAKHTTQIGIIEAINRLLHTKRTDKMKADVIQKALEQMEIKPPEDLNKIIDKALEE